MSKFTPSLMILVTLLSAPLYATPAAAGAARTFVSPTGSDSNLCTLVAPCRFLQAALLQTNPGGEIAVLGTAGYNNGATVNINQAVSIVNPGGYEAGIAVPSGGIGIVISAGTNDAVSLRGLTIEGGGVGAVGIVFHTGASLTVGNCVIRHMNNDGINFFSNTATSSLTVSNSLLADNNVYGIFLQPTGSATAVFNRVEVNNNAGYGIVVDGNQSAGTNTINATVSDSVAAGNNVGFVSFSQSGQAPTSVMVSHSVAANNGSGVGASGTGATLRLANSTLTGNTNGWQAIGGGVVDSYGDNYIDGNAGNIGSLTSIARQ
jgi:hypothetical protein